ncbi:hypothetical protein V6N11_019642 [Hibiscus sabdariffa]|uniref:Uncharacterized protein n=1 Tax=Hibiscus sabdariffa TaxID=183260 RepID=A0ABR2NLM5_9ROSI
MNEKFVEFRSQIGEDFRKMLEIALGKRIDPVAFGDSNKVIAEGVLGSTPTVTTSTLVEEVQIIGEKDPKISSPEVGKQTVGSFRSFAPPALPVQLRATNSGAKGLFHAQMPGQTSSFGSRNATPTYVSPNVVRKGGLIQPKGVGKVLSTAEIED